MTRGFITIATGNIHYYEIAANLLLSYRAHTSHPYSFAIIAEEENQYTALFDDVILTTEATRSFLDKFLLLKLCPYDETIFFDADSLAYGDLNEYWDLFDNADDVSSLGANFPVEQSGGAWFDVEDIGKYGKNLPHKTRVHLGVCFVRNSDTSIKMYNDCMDIQKNLDKIHFHTAPLSVDECVFGLAMSINGLKALPENAHIIGVYPCLKSLRANMMTPQLVLETYWHDSTTNGILLHWGTVQTYKPLYRFEVECLRCKLKHSDQSLRFSEKLLYQHRIRYYLLCISYIPIALRKRIVWVSTRIRNRIRSFFAKQH